MKNQHVPATFLILCFILIALCIGCSDQEKEKINAPSKQSVPSATQSKTLDQKTAESIHQQGKNISYKPPVILPGDDVIMATVNDEKITLFDLEFGLEQMLGKTSPKIKDPQTRKNALKNLVLSKALAQEYEKEMSPEEKMRMDKKLTLYREELMITEYLKHHAHPEPVSYELIERYYHEHPEEFGAQTLKSFEMISTTRAMDSKEKDIFLAVLKYGAQTDDWNNFDRTLKKRGYPVVYRKISLDDQSLHQSIREVSKELAIKEVSPIIPLNNRLHIVRLENEMSVPPRPLKAVEDEIRRSLRPIQLKKAIQLAKEKILREKQVIYHY